MVHISMETNHFTQQNKVHARTARHTYCVARLMRSFCNATVHMRFASNVALTIYAFNLPERMITYIVAFFLTELQNF
jgi:hypothetical protein